MSIELSVFILVALFAALIGAFENAISATGKRAIKRNYTRVVESIMMILYGSIYVGIIRRPFDYLAEKFPNRSTRNAGIGYPKWEDK